MKREWIATLVLVCLCGGVFAQGEPEALDVDSNGKVDALTDGLLALRHMFGFHGAALTAGAVANDCARCEAAEIEQ